MVLMFKNIRGKISWSYVDTLDKVPGALCFIRATVGKKTKDENLNGIGLAK
jgi:hypothetical protein